MSCTSVKPLPNKPESQEPPKVLVVDDNIELLSAISEHLANEGYLIHTAVHESSAQSFLAYNRYDAIILDHNLPDTSGVEIYRRLRNGRVTTPVILLTRPSAMIDKNSDFNIGAECYLTKPFSLRELVARLQALKCRPNPQFSDKVICGGLELHLVNRTLTRDGIEIHLSPIEFALLELFMKHPQRFFSTDVLLARIWPSQKDSTDVAVRASIKRLRRKLDGADVDESDSMIESNRRVGYRFREKLELPLETQTRVGNCLCSHGES
jgi:DNA-binding response OmpR family regulator